MVSAWWLVVIGLVGVAAGTFLAASVFITILGVTIMRLRTCEDELAAATDKFIDTVIDLADEEEHSTKI